MTEPGLAEPDIVAKLNGMTANQLIALGVLCSGLGTLRRLADRNQEFDSSDLHRFSQALENVLHHGRSPAATVAAARQVLEDGAKIGS